MTSPRSIQRHAPQPSIDLDGVLDRLGELADANPCESCEPFIDSAVADITLLCLEVSRMHGALVKERLRSANFEAAIWAALGAESDGEAAPLSYLRDECPGDPDDSGGWG
jgi:hypothetical protein